MARTRKKILNLYYRYTSCERRGSFMGSLSLFEYYAFAIDRATGRRSGYPVEGAIDRSNIR